MVAEVVKCLEDAKIILYPTDTVWGIGCDATNEKAVQKIYDLKKREESKSLITLVDSIEMLKNYVATISGKVLDILNETEKPTTIIYNSPNGLAKNTIASDNTIAIRIPKNDFCLQMIKEFGKPIVSTSANISGSPTPQSYSEISNDIKDNVDYVVDLNKEKVNKQSSTILKIEGGSIVVIRE